MNEVYLKLGRESKASDLPTLGDELDVTPEYLGSSIETLGAFGTLLCVSCLLKLQEDYGPTYEWGASQASRLLQDKQYRASAMVASKLLSIAHGRLERVLELQLRHVEWNARKLLKGTDDVRAEVEDYDYSGLELRSRHMRAVLLDEDETAREEIGALVEQGKLARSAVRLRVEYEGLIRRSDRDWLAGGGER